MLPDDTENQSTKVTEDLFIGHLEPLPDFTRTGTQFLYIPCQHCGSWHRVKNRRLLIPGPAGSIHHYRPTGISQDRWISTHLGTLTVSPDLFRAEWIIEGLGGSRDISPAYAMYATNRQDLT